MSNGLDQFVNGSSVVDRPFHVAGHLVRAAEGYEGGNGDEAAVPFGKPGPLPDVTEEDPVGERHEFGGEVADQLLGASWPCRHVCSVVVGGRLADRLPRLAVVLGIGDVGAPTGGRLVVVAGALSDGQVGHEVVGRGTVPVLLIAGGVDNVTARISTMASPLVWARSPSVT